MSLMTGTWMFECDKGDCWKNSGTTKGCQSLQYLHILISDNLNKPRRTSLGNAANYPFHPAPKNYFAKHFSHTLCDFETFDAYIKQLTKLLFCRSLNPSYSVFLRNQTGLQPFTKWIMGAWGTSRITTTFILSRKIETVLPFLRQCAFNKTSRTAHCVLLQAMYPLPQHVMVASATQYTILLGDRHRVGGIATRYALWGCGFETRVETRHFATVETPCGPTSLLYNGHRTSSPEVKRLERGVEQPTASSAKVKQRVELYFYSPACLHGLL